MIKLSANAIAAMQRDIVEYFYTLKISELDGTIIKAITDNSYDVTLSDTVTYISDGTLVSVKPPKIDTVVDREQYDIAIADPLFMEGTKADNGYISNFVEVRMVFLDGTPPVPLTNIADTFLMYSGRVDNSAYRINTRSTGEAILKLTCTSPLADLDHRKGLYLSRDVIRNRDPNDSTCDDIYFGSKTVQLKWGKS